MVQNDRTVRDSEGQIVCRPLVPLGRAPWPEEIPTVKLANPLADPPARPRPPITRKYDYRALEAQCQQAAARCTRVATRCGRYA